MKSSIPESLERASSRNQTKTPPNVKGMDAQTYRTNAICRLNVELRRGTDLWLEFFAQSLCLYKIFWCMHGSCTAQASGPKQMSSFRKVHGPTMRARPGFSVRNNVPEFIAHRTPKSPTWLNQGIHLKSHQGCLCTLRYIPELNHLGLFGIVAVRARGLVSKSL